jgi:hypothetical protein
VSDSGRLSIMVSIPSGAGAFVGQDLYSRQEGQMDFTRSQVAVQAEAETTLEKIQQIELRVQDRDLQRARQLLDQALSSARIPLLIRRRAERLPRRYSRLAPCSRAYAPTTSPLYGKLSLTER